MSDDGCGIYDVAGPNLKGVLVFCKKTWYKDFTTMGLFSTEYFFLKMKKI